MERLLDDPDAGEKGLVAVLGELSRQGDAALTEPEIRSQLRTFVFAGHDTTASAMAFAIQLLGEHPDVASRFHDEVDTVLGGSGPTLADLDELRTTENVVRETLRLYPPAFRLPRVAAEAVEVGGYTVDAGTDVLVYTVAPHRDERFWEDPFEFRPRRWNGVDPDATGYEYLPFGAGPRGCIAERFALLETRLLLATIGRRYAFTPLSEMEISARVSASPKGSLPTRVTRRDT